MNEINTGKVCNGNVMKTPVNGNVLSALQTLSENVSRLEALTLELNDAIQPSTPIPCACVEGVNSENFEPTLVQRINRLTFRVNVASDQVSDTLEVIHVNLNGIKLD